MQWHAGAGLIRRGEGCPPQRAVDHRWEVVAILVVHTANVPLRGFGGLVRTLGPVKARAWLTRARHATPAAAVLRCAAQ